MVRSPSRILGATIRPPSEVGPAEAEGARPTVLDELWPGPGVITTLVEVMCGRVGLPVAVRRVDDTVPVAGAVGLPLQFISSLL